MTLSRPVSIARLLRVALGLVALAAVSGGGCILVVNDDDHDDDDDNHTTVIIDNDSAFATAGQEGGGGLDREVFRLGRPGPLSPTRLWPPGQIGEAELAVFAAGVLALNAELLELPVPASELQYLDTQVEESTALVRFTDGEGRAGALVSARFAASGELIAIEQLSGDSHAHLR